MIFPYVRYGHEIRPVIPISIKILGSEIEYEHNVLVDSGADICVFSYEVAEDLGITPSMGVSCEPIRLGGRESECFIYPISFRVGGWSHSAEVRFFSKKSDRKMPYGIVGQSGFFQYFKIKFDRAKEFIEIAKK